MQKRPPTRTIRPPTLRVDAAKYPNLAANRSLERALRIRQALEMGKPRHEAVALAELAVGPAAGRRRAGGKAARPKRQAAKARKG